MPAVVAGELGGELPGSSWGTLFWKILCIFQSTSESPNGEVQGGPNILNTSEPLEFFQDLQC